MRAKRALPWMIALGGAAGVIALRGLSSEVPTWLAGVGREPATASSVHEPAALQVPHLTFRWRQTAVAKSQGNVAWDIEVAGSIELFELDARAGDVVGRSKSTEVRLRRGSEEQLAEVLERAKASANSAFRFQRNDSGVITGAGFPTVERDHRLALLRATLAGLQVSFAGPAEKLEPTSSGPCQVAYAQKKPGVIDKNSTSCKFVTPQGDEVQTSLASFRVAGSFQIAESRRVTSSRYTEETSLGDGPEKLIVELTTELSLVTEDTAVNPYPEYRKWALFPLHGSPVTTASSARRAEVEPRDLERLGGQTYNDLVAELSRAIDTNKPDEAREAIMKLKVLFRAQPDAMKLARAEIQDGLPVKKAEPMMGAMSMAGGAEAEAQLIELVNDANLEPEVREYSIAHLGSLDAPSDTVVSTLAAMSADESMGELRPQSLTSLGASLRRGAAVGGSQVQDEAMQQLIEISRSASSTKEQADSMLALGNTARPAALEAIAAGLASANPMVRDTAVFALREIGGAEVDAMIASVLAHDPEVGVRVSAARALGYRVLTITTAASVLEALRAEREAVVRGAVLSAVADGRRVTPDSPAYPIVAWMAQSDPDPTLRARAALAPSGA
jgi:hypothetical protein